MNVSMWNFCVRLNFVFLLFPSEGSSSRTKEHLLASKDIERYEERRRAADSVKTRAESELLEAKKTDTNVKSLIGKSTSKAKVNTRNSKMLRRAYGLKVSFWVARNSERYPYEKLSREPENVKQELSKLKLDVASVLEEKSQVEKEDEVPS